MQVYSFDEIKNLIQILYPPRSGFFYNGTEIIPVRVLANVNDMPIILLQSELSPKEFMFTHETGMFYSASSREELEASLGVLPREFTWRSRLAEKSQISYTSRRETYEVRVCRVNCFGIGGFLHLKRFDSDVSWDFVHAHDSALVKEVENKPISRAYTNLLIPYSLDWLQNLELLPSWREKAIEVSETAREDSMMELAASLCLMNEAGMNPAGVYTTTRECLNSAGGSETKLWFTDFIFNLKVKGPGKDVKVRIVRGDYVGLSISARSSLIEAVWNPEHGYHEFPTITLYNPLLLAGGIRRRINIDAGGSDYVLEAQGGLMDRRWFLLLSTIAHRWTHYLY